MDDTQTPFEVRCLSCETSFPVGTKRCIHCGGRIAGPRKRAAPRRQGRPPIFGPARSQAPAPSPGAPKPGNTGAVAAPDFETDPEAYVEHVLEHGDEEPEEATGRPMRISLWGISVGLALVGSLLRNCQGG